MSEKNADKGSGDTNPEPPLPAPRGSEELDDPKNKGVFREPQQENSTTFARDFNKAMKKTASAVSLAAVGGILSGLGAIGSMIVGITQCNFNSAQVSIMRQDQRSWIGVDSIAAKPLEPGKPIVAVVVLKNTGKTPAKEVVCITSIVLKNGVCKDVSEFDAITNPASQKKDTALNSRSVMMPGAQMSVQLGETPISEDFIKNIRAGQFTVYLEVKITYRDIFGVSHFTSNFAHYDPKGENYGSEPTGNDFD